MVEVVSEARSGIPPLSGAPQLEQKRLASALRCPHLVQTGMDEPSCLGVNPPPVLEVDGSEKPMRPAPAGSTDDAPEAPELSLPEPDT
ncbi:hypothetical protein GCM10010207_68530 [Streptomyces atratus]|nr:hypothetical protein GCM10010207_68530 [Streptomyces atratus]